MENATVLLGQMTIDKYEGIIGLVTPGEVDLWFLSLDVLEIILLPFRSHFNMHRRPINGLVSTPCDPPGGSLRLR